MKKIVIVFLFSLLLFNVKKTAFGAAWSVNDVPSANTSYSNEGRISNPPYVFESTKNLLYFFCSIIGINTCPMFTDQQQVSYQQHTVLARVSQGIELAYAKPPASTGEYLAYLGSKAGIVQPAYAQGIGFSGLSPIIDIWRAFRNIAYGFLILIMVIVGFMILFRWKIDPRTVITIQSALPRIVVTLIIITFSYAIVGLMIDVMYLAIYIPIFALGKTDPTIIQNFTGGAVSNLYGTLYNTGQSAVNDIVNFFLGSSPDLIRAVTGAIGGAIGAIIVGPGVGLLTGGLLPAIGIGAGAAAGIALPQVFVSAFVAIAMLFLLIRLFLTLLTAWIQVFIALIFGPLQLMLGAIPGVNVFGSWFKNLVANLAAFPITMILILIGSYLSSSGTSGRLWTPPGFGGTPEGQGVAGLIGLGVAMIIPSVVNNFKQAIKAVSFVPAGPGAIVAPFGSAMGTGMQLLSTQYYLKNSPVAGLLGRIPGVGKMFQSQSH